MQRIILVSLLVLGLSSSLWAQVDVTVVQGGKEAYRPDDVFVVNVVVHTRPETCLDGMKLTKIYYSGLEADSQSEWSQIKTGVWQKSIHLHVLKIARSSARVTLMRRVDKENLFQQVIYPIQENMK